MAAGVVLIGVLNALAVAVGLSVIDVVRRSARPHDAVLGWVERLGRWADVSVHRDAVTSPGIVVYRLDDRLFFANAEYVKGRVREAIGAAPRPPRWLVIDLGGTSTIDATGLKVLHDVCTDLAAQHIGVAVAQARAGVLTQLEAGGIFGLIGPANLHPTVRVAVAAYEEPPPSGDRGVARARMRRPPEGGPAELDLRTSKTGRKFR